MDHNKRRVRAEREQQGNKKANFHILNKSNLFRLSDHTKQETFNYNDRFKEVLWDALRLRKSLNLEWEILIAGGRRNKIHHFYRIIYRFLVYFYWYFLKFVIFT